MKQCAGRWVARFGDLFHGMSARTGPSTVWIHSFRGESTTTKGTKVHEEMGRSFALIKMTKWGGWSRLKSARGWGSGGTGSEGESSCLLLSHWLPGFKRGPIRDI